MFVSYHIVSNFSVLCTMRCAAHLLFSSCMRVVLGRAYTCSMRRVVRVEAVLEMCSTKLCASVIIFLCLAGRRTDQGY